MRANEDVRARLLETQKTLHDRFKRIKNDRRKVDGPLAADWQEQAVDLENAEVLDHLDVGARKELEEIAAALARLDAGTYGECMECGDTIPAGRLKALPYATLCVSCAS